MEVPFHEMDALVFGPQWSMPSDFVVNVDRVLREPAWVIDSYGHEAVRDAMWAAADTIVWLDFPLRVVVARVVRRSLSRSARRTPVFGGNIETWRAWLSPDHPVWWAARKFGSRRRYLNQRTKAQSHLTTVRLTSTLEFDRWLAQQT